MPQGPLAGWCPACLLNQGAGPESGERTGARAFTPPSLEEVARLFPQLEVLCLLGAGGMGAVYKARQPALDRMVALKILPATGRTGFAERFNREARALARLSHPNIVAVHEFGQVEHLHFFIMEFVDGANLRQLEKAARLSPREALQIIPQICDALQYAHDEGIVHRDIKPENVLLDRKGRVKIADFGLAKIAGGDTDAHRLTMEGQVMGTPLYMAPEQMERPLSVDHRADIYSLGVVFYEMLTGDLPIGKFQPPSSKVQVDVRLDEVVLRALENDPERRYQKASEVKQGVATVTEGPAPLAAGSHATPGAAAAPAPAPAPLPPRIRYLHWAGIPVVVERDGEREVSFTGALGALAAILAAVAVGLFTVQWVTGAEHVSPRICLLVAGWTLFFAIRSTLKRPAPVEPRTPSGTVVVPPSKAFRWQRGYAALIGLVVFVIGVQVLKTKVLDRHNEGWDVKPPAVTQAARDPATGGLVASLPGGATVELVAVANPDAAPNQWWLPDGRPESNLAFRVYDPARTTRDVTVAKDVLFRLTNLPQGADFGFFSSDPPASIGSGGHVSREGQPVPQMIQAQFGWKTEPREATIQAGLGLEPWQARTTFLTDGPVIQVPRQPGMPWWNANLHNRAETAGGVQVTLVLSAMPPGWNTRMVLIDTNDVVHTYNQASGMPGETAGTWTYTFAGLTLSQVKAFEFQVRPIHTVVFKDVALEPNAPLSAALPFVFSPVMFQVLTFNNNPPGVTLQYKRVLE